ncbi:Triacylglycerol lipase protein [Dioscorea alata]|uniref:Triacylglycerol lipase protein n=3 Tax=Dioscorea alata TaxID=55571 RepID=A0ACB7U3G8_DIOAL|nr:Triacylglycerol lipase protein [Dioscorea alata]KAH7654857.1 Triacylglycerol lipase protein [Dioscorea alata]KAH7654858.1 Triacylglycerol lipase protein [Dioscorea alata]
MAIPLPKLNPSFSQLPYKHCSSSNHSLQPLLSIPRPLPTLATTASGRCHAVAKNDSLTSMISELERDSQKVDEADDELNEFIGKQPATGLADRWREIHGRDDWAGLLDPMDPLLRSELIRYGEFAQACYDAFDYDPFSRYCGSCKHGRRHFFQDLGIPDTGYEVVRYLYATSNLSLPTFFTQSRWPKMWSRRANWIGYIAVSDDATSAKLGRRDIMVSWRGTVTRLEWLADLMDFLRPVSDEGIPCSDPSVKVESGFIDLYTDKDPSCRFCKYSAREQVLAAVRKLVHQHARSNAPVSITLTGHSLGSALAMLSAYDIAETSVNVVDNESLPVCVYSFSGPRVGNGKFKQRFESLGVKALRVVNVHDTVPKVPGILFNESVPAFVQRMAEGLPWSYSHVGVELALDHKNSPFLKETSDPSCYHNLEAHLHLLDGYHGRGQRFVLASGRDPALVNKACDFLKDHHMVPPFWRQDLNKGMIRAEDGRWVQAERPVVHDDHLHDVYHHLEQLGLSFNH